MGYYDFDHFWSPEEVCAQKNHSEATLRILTEVKKFLHELLGCDFCDRHLKILTPDEKVNPLEDDTPNNQDQLDNRFLD